MARLRLSTVLYFFLSTVVINAQNAVSSCGIPVNQPTLSRIRGGQEAAKHSWPWQVRLGVKMLFGTAFMCGGSILDQYHILTASHCFIQKFPFGATYFVRVGDHNMNINEVGQKDYDVATVIEHPDFDMGEEFVQNDIAILKLKKPIVFSNTVKPICLPDKDADVLVGRTCYITGWGSTVNQTTGQYKFKPASPLLNLVNKAPLAPEPIVKPSNVLKQALMPVLERSVCQELWGPTILDHMVCMWDTSFSDEPCQGDSGGPLNCLAEDGTTWNVEGVVSFGAGCGMHAPAVFTRVGSFIDWIQKTIK